ncbi:MAG: hypothetical protein AAF849_20235 [Bacteroidota bacterium]
MLTEYNDKIVLNFSSFSEAYDSTNEADLQHIFKMMKAQQKMIFELVVRTDQRA